MCVCPILLGQLLGCQSRRTCFSEGFWLEAMDVVRAVDDQMSNTAKFNTKGQYWEAY